MLIYDIETDKNTYLEFLLAKRVSALHISFFWPDSVRQHGTSSPPCTSGECHLLLVTFATMRQKMQENATYFPGNMANYHSCSTAGAHSNNNNSKAVAGIACLSLGLQLFSMKGCHTHDGHESLTKKRTL